MILSTYTETWILPPVMGQVTASAPRKVPGRDRFKNCFHYDRLGQATEPHRTDPAIGPEPGDTKREQSSHLAPAAAVMDSGPTGDEDDTYLPSQLFGDRDLQISINPRSAWL